VVECNLNVYDAVTGDGTIGPVAKKLVETWNDLVGLDFIAQAKAYLEEMRSKA